MPAPETELLSKLTKVTFIAKKVTLPADWEDKGEQFDDAFQPQERQVLPNSPMNLFREATTNKYHVDAAKDVSAKFEVYIDGICLAICSAIDKWMQQASIAGVVINGPVGTILPGCVTGPSLMPLIMDQAPQNTPQETKYSNAIAAAFTTQWLAWHMGIAGMLMYPSFAAFPGPVAPPTPNVPVPLIILPSAGEPELAPDALKDAMEDNFGDPDAPCASDLFDSIATAFNIVFQMFKATTMVTNVSGTGPVPIFAPPFVPVGPVLGGSVIPSPGVLK